MAEYIEREQALDVINLADFIADEHGLLLYADSVQACFLDIPAADVQPVVRGEWIKVGSIENTWLVSRCSACGAQTIDAGRYCPNCGATMEADDG